MDRSNTGDRMDQQDIGQLDPADVEEVLELGEDVENADVQLVEEMQQVELVHYDMEDEDQDTDSTAEGAEAMELQDDSAVSFTKHTASVFCVHVDPQNSSLAVSGGEDDKAYVWNTSNGELSFECAGHKDSVTCVAFSHDSKYVATGDMGGLVQVWKVDTQALVWSFESSDLEWLEWHHGAPVLLAGTVDGDIWMWKIPSGDTKTFQSYGSSTGIGRIMPDGKRLCCGYQDGSVRIWDLKSVNQIHGITGHLAHQSGVTCLDCHHDNSLVVTGSTDGTVKIINSVTGKVVGTLDCSRQKDSDDTESSVEAVGFSKSQPCYIATGTISGDLNIWDVTTMTLRHACKHEAGIVRLKWDAVSPLLYTCTLDGVLHLWDSRFGKRESQWFGHTEEILDFDISRDSNILVTASGDKTAKVFTLHIPDR